MESFDLKSLIGKGKIVLYFYPKDDTPGCTIQAIDFTDHEQDFAKVGTTVIGISPDDCLSHAAFRDKHGLSVRLLADPDREACRLYGVWQEKEKDGVKKMGVVRSTFVIDTKGVVTHALYNVQAKGHALEMLKLVREMS